MPDYQEGNIDGIGYWFTSKPIDMKPIPISPSWASGGEAFMKRFSYIKLPPGFHESNITMMEDPDTGNMLISNGEEVYVLELPKADS